MKDVGWKFIQGLDSSWKGHEAFAYWLVKRLKPKVVVDLGFDRALSTIVFAYKNRGHVYGIDWFDQGGYAQKSFALDSAYRNVSNAIRFGYVKNLHLIIGPFNEISKTWTKQIDILHIDWSHTYASAKERYDNWSRYLDEQGVILVHDVTSHPSETGRFFKELPMPSVIFPHAKGLGVASKNGALIEEIKAKFFGTC